jgi:beta-N-acetylhexosaminidase
VIGVRAFGEEPELVARLGAAAASGFAAGGVLATLKHFPGHGDTATDSHLALPVIPATRERLERIELVPFVRGIQQGADCIMIAHVALPALMPPDAMLPASISSAIVQGLLRDQLGFRGVAITDCLEMNAVSEGVGVGRGAVLALLAGNDLVLVSHRIERQRAALDAVLAALGAGELAPERVREAAGRMLALKQRHLSWDRLPQPAGLDVVGRPAHRELAARAFAAATTLVRDEARQVPLRLSSDVRLLVAVVLPRAVTQASDSALDADALLASVRRFHPAATIECVVPGAEADLVRLEADAARADAVLLATINCHVDERQRAAALRIVSAAGRVVGLAACDPYDAGALPSVGTFLASYEYSAPALSAAVDVLFGLSPTAGRLPVTV